jgi:hypothetical protein
MDAAAPETGSPAGIETRDFPDDSADGSGVSFCDVDTQLSQCFGEADINQTLSQGISGRVHDRISADPGGDAYREDGQLN